MVEYDLGLVVGSDGAKGDKGDKGDKGAKGDAGRGITSILKTGSSGKVDTYTITYSDGSTSTFTVTNGSDASVTVDNSLSSTSTNPVQNKVIKGALDGKANSSHNHNISDVSNLQSSLDGKSDTGHTHTKSNITDFAHTHDDRYYTESETDNLLSGKASSSHTHTKSEITDFPTSMTPTSHSHGDLTNDGKITTSYVEKDTNDFPVVADNSDGKKLKRGQIYTGFVWDNYARPNIGTSAQATQTAINNAIDTKIGSLESLIGDAILFINGTGGS